jgi:type II secretory pathway component PulK
MKTRAPHHFARGSALLVVLWAVVVLSAAIFAWAQYVEQNIRLHGNAGLVLEARAMAHSGVAVALHPRVNKQTPLLEGTLGDGLFYKARLISEGGKLNLNWLCTGEDQRKLTILKTWLQSRGLNFRDIDRFVDCLLDYIDADNIKHLNGAEDEGDYHAANRPLLSIDEVAAVMGSGPLVATPGWKDQLTIDSSGPIDILAAPAEILRLLPGFSEPRVQRLLTLRAGPDGIEGTADDPIFQSLDQALQSIGFAQQEIALVKVVAMINDPVVRIISAGQSGKVIRQVEVVARKGTLTPLILSWKE